ncbi:MAG TPA: PilN domain-containing protein [Gemmatimonadaceae bacterium]|nr:PilN domain-containing protein [Gemmatimonadaceae bacterium]
MIEINLLPGSGKKSKKSGGGGPKLNLGASFDNLKSRIRDPFLIGALVSAVVAAVALGGLYTTQEARAARLDEELQKSVQDSTRYASVLREREKAEAKRDTVLRSLNMIRAIDDDRYIWPHVMDEVSSALPPYTWIVSLSFSGAGQATSPIATVLAPEPAGSSGRRRKGAPTQVVRDTIRVRLVGNTVDIQALTRFMKQLEVSPLLENVSLVSSQRANDNGKEVTQFQLDMLYTRPGATDVRRVPLAVSVR